jgi:hypothetical protein
VNARGTRLVTVYAQFWMINRTGLPLFFKQVPTDHNAKIDIGTHR